jgi:hypothetical protein
LSEENLPGSLLDLAEDALKEQIGIKLQALFDLYMRIPDFQFPRGKSIQTIAAHIHQDIEDLAVLQNIYLDLVNKQLESPYFQPRFFAEWLG